jgi:hypothetical protein
MLFLIQNGGEVKQLFIITHMCLGTLLYKQLSQYEELKLDKKWFVYGNIAPDFSPKKKCFKHYDNVSMKMIEDIIIELEEHALTQQKYSLRLGELSHFICDVFCLYHQNEYSNKNMLQHFWYELKLHMYFKTTFAKKETLDFLTKDISVDFVDNFVESLKNLQSYYKNQPNSFEKDLNCAFNMMRLMVHIYEKNMLHLRVYDYTNIR